MADVGADGTVGAHSTLKLEQEGPSTIQLVDLGNNTLTVQERGPEGIALTLTPAPFANVLVATEQMESQMYAIALGPKGVPSAPKSTDLRAVVMDFAVVPELRSVYISEGSSNTIARLKIDKNGGVKQVASYFASGSLPGLAYDPKNKRLWVGEGALTSFDLSADPDLKKPRRLESKEIYEGVDIGDGVLIAERKVETDSLPEKAFDIFQLSGPEAKKLGGFKPEVDPCVYDLSADGKWLYTGGFATDKKVRSYRIEGGKATLVDTLDIGDICDGLDVYGNLLVVKLRENVALVATDEGKLTVRFNQPGAAATLIPLAIRKPGR